MTRNKFQILEDIPKLGETPEPEAPEVVPVPKKKAGRKPDPNRKPFVPKANLPMWEQPLLSLADKYRLALAEIDRLNGAVASD